MNDIVLTTLNARYAHASFGLRYLRANLGELRDRSRIVEFDTTRRTTDIIETLLAHNPKIVGIGVYIWNAPQSAQLVAELKRIRPDITVIIGGPEVSYEVEQQQICRDADYVITGEADLAFAELCRAILSGKRPLMKVIAAQLPEFDALTLPYDEYNDEDVAQRVVYVEASRGCPFKCEFCLSSLDVPVRNVPLDQLLGAMQKLLDRGLRQFKFVDRTFNLNLNFSRSILEFFLERYEPGLFLHFEMIPDRLPDALRGVIEKFPAGALQFEVGVQSFNPEVQQLISRKQDNNKLEDNLRWLRDRTGVHVHADLIVGLPGEDIDRFASGFDRLVTLAPQEIQVGMLKRLRGTPITRHDAEWGMVYSPSAPYEILQTKLIDFASMQKMRRFARFWDLIANSGNFVSTISLILAGSGGPGSGPAGSGVSEAASSFWNFMRLSNWLYQRIGQTHSIALDRLAELLYEHLGTMHDPATVAPIMWTDLARSGRRDVPEFLRKYVAQPPRGADRTTGLPRRQSKHLKKAEQP